MNPMLTIGVVLAVLAVPLALSLVPPNPVYGLRTPATCSSRAVWFAANSHVGRLAVLGGSLLALAGLMAGHQSPAGVFLERDDVQMIASVGVVLGITLAGIGRARRLAKGLQGSPQEAPAPPR